MTSQSKPTHTLKRSLCPINMKDERRPQFNIERIKKAGVVKVLYRRQYKLGGKGKESVYGQPWEVRVTNLQDGTQVVMSRKRAKELYEVA